MPPSQLKSLKASLRQQGILGPQQSKKEKQRGGKGTAQQRQRRNDSLAEIRERFNPFEVKKLARGAKYEFASNSPQDDILGRPGVTRGRGEEVRRNTLLKDMERRQKVGGLVDRRFGESDPTMTPEDRALQRFLREKQSRSRKTSMFNLEEEAEDDAFLTHKGRSLNLVETARDDFDTTGLEDSDGDVDEEGRRRGQKRPRLENGEGASGSDEDDRPKTKKEVMSEVIAKSKLYRYERQKAKEDDEDLREQLDAGTRDMLTALRANGSMKQAIQPTPRLEPAMDPDRAALLAGKDRKQADREYDMRLRQMAQEARAQPTTPTKTEEEKAEEEAQRLQALEEKRLRRMRGESVSDEEREDDDGDYETRDDFDEENILGKGVPAQVPTQLEVEDEDQFILDKDLVAEGSDLEFESLSESVDTGASDSDDEEFLAGLLSAGDAGRINPAAAATRTNGTAETLSYTYPCPQTHDELLAVTRGTAYEDLHTIIQRIRTLYHARLATENKEKLATFATMLVQHLAHLAQAEPRPPYATLEALIRHVHSLAKSYPIEVSLAYRAHLQAISSQRPLDLTAADLVVLTAISTTFPTSDHYHPIASPAMMTLARALGQKIPRTLAELVTGMFAATLCLRYQALAKRYVPEVVSYLLHTMSVLAPVPSKQPFGPHPPHAGLDELRIPTEGSVPKHAGPLQFADVEFASGASVAEDSRVKHALLATALQLVSSIATLWQHTDSFPEIFQPFVAAIAHLKRPVNAKRLASSILVRIFTTSHPPFHPASSLTIPSRPSPPSTPPSAHSLPHPSPHANPCGFTPTGPSPSRHPSRNSSPISIPTSTTMPMSSGRPVRVYARSIDASAKERCASCARMRHSWRAMNSVKRSRERGIRRKWKGNSLRMCKRLRVRRGGGMRRRRRGGGRRGRRRR